MSDALQNANKIIEKLSSMGFDYSDKAQELADLWDSEGTGLWYGNDDAITDFEDGTRNIIVVQEDYYDQHMSEEDKPDEKLFIIGLPDYVYFYED